MRITSILILILIAAIKFSDINIVSISLFNQVLLSLVLVRYLKKNKHLILSPSSLFTSFFLVFSIGGHIIWIFRELEGINYKGSPFEICVIFNLLSIIFINSFLFQNYKKYVLKIHAGDEAINNIILKLVVLVGLTYIGSYLYTSGFVSIPIFNKNLYYSRLELRDTGHTMGKGLGAVLLFGGLIPIAISFIYILKLKFLKNKLPFLFIIILTYIPFVFYAGRLMIFLPLIVVFIIYIKEKNLLFNKKELFKFIFILVLVFCFIIGFGVLRVYSGGTPDFRVFNYIISDTFPEFWGSVYTTELVKNVNIDFKILPTVLSGMVPNIFFDIINFKKTDFYQPIGAQIAELWGINLYYILGIRISFFGELIVSGLRDFLLFTSFVLILLHKGNRLFISALSTTIKMNFIIINALIFACVIPYGTGFLMSSLQIFILSWLYYKFLFWNIW